MSRKKKIKYHSYMEGNIRYLSCSICGNYERVSDEAVSVKCSGCVLLIMMKQFPSDEPKSAYKPTGRPAGWHWMNEFVDKDGVVFHKGKEVPELKGTLPPTKVIKKKTKRRTKAEIEADKIKKYRKKKKAYKKKLKDK